jgi:hypothetical protein
MEKVKENKKFIRFFKYDNEYISGWTFFRRTFLNCILLIFFGLGLYLQSVNVYKRGKALGYKSNELWAVFGFIQFPLLYLLSNIYFFDYQGLIYNLPMWYLWFSNGNNYNGIISFNELNISNDFFTLKNELYSGDAYVKNGNIITDQFNFINGKKILHKSYYKYPIIDFQEDWFYENYNEHTDAITNQYRIWHHNGNLAQNSITYKNGEQTEEKFDKDGSNFVKSEVID